MAEELQKTTPYMDDVILGAQAILATFAGLRGQIFEGALKQAINLSVVLGKDLSGAAQQLGKALESPAEGLQSLRRFGIVLSATAREEIENLQAAGNLQAAQRLLLQEIDKRYGDVGEKIQGPFAKALHEAGVSWREFGQAMGEAFTKNPDVIANLHAIAGAMEWLTKRVRKFNEASFDRALQELEAEKHVLEMQVKAGPVFGLFGPSVEESKRRLEEATAKIEELKKLTAPAAPPPGTPPPIENNLTDKARKEAERLAKERLKAVLASLDGELKLYRAQKQAENAENENNYARGEKGFEAYWAKRQELTSSALDKEAEILYRKRAGVQNALLLEPPKGEADQLAMTTEIRKLTAEIAVSEQARLEQAFKMETEVFNAKRAHTKEELAYQRDLEAATGQRWEAERTALRAALAEREKYLKTTDLSPDSISHLLEIERRVGEAAIRFEEVREQAELAMSSLARAKAGIRDQVQAGLKTEAEGEEEVLRLEKERLPVLEMLADLQEEVAKETGNIQKIEEARNFQQTVSGIRTETWPVGASAWDQVGVRLRSLSDELQVSSKDWADTVETAAQSMSDSLSSHLTAAFTTGKLGAKEMVDEILAQTLRLGIETAISKPLVSGFMDLMSQAMASPKVPSGADYLFPTTDAGGRTLTKVAMGPLFDTFKVENHSGAEVGTPTATRNASGGLDLNLVISKTGANDVATRGPLGQTLERIYGLKRI